MAITTATYDATYIYVSGGQVGTVDEVTAAIGDTAIMEKVGSVHTIKGNRGLYIGTTTNTHVTLSSGQTLDILKTSNAYALRVTDYCEFEMEEGTTLICSSPSAAAGIGGYIYIYGRLTAVGTSVNPITIMKPRYFRLFGRSNTNNTAGQSHLEYVNIKNMRYRYAATLEFYNMDQFAFQPTHIFRHVLITNDTSDGGILNYGYGIALHGGDYSNCIFEDITVEKNYYGIYSYGGIAKFTRCHFKENYNRVVSGYGSAPCAQGYSQYHDMKFGNIAQGYLTFDDCIFENNYTSTSSRRAFQTYSSNSIKLIDCEFKTAYYAIFSDYQSCFFVVRPTFTSITNYDYYISSAGVRAVNIAWELDLTVYDPSGNLIEGATVIVNQSENKETATFITDSNGAALDYFGDFPVFSEKQMYTHTPSYYNWSQSGDNYHDIIVSKPGYLMERRKVYFTEDKTIDIHLRAEAGVRALPQN